MFGWKNARCIAYGLLLGTAGVRILTSQDAKKVYTHVTAAALRCVDEVTRTATALRENCGDIAAEARQMNEERAALARSREIEDAKAVLAAAEAESAQAAAAEA